MQLEGFGERGDDRRREVAGRGVVLVVVVERDARHELVASNARWQRVGVRGAARAPQTVGDLHQELVTRHVPERVVDQLEAVEVDMERGEAPPFLGPGAHVARIGDAVGQLGQRVVGGEEAHAVLRELGLRHVRDDPAEAEKRAALVVARPAAGRKPAIVALAVAKRDQEVVEGNALAQEARQLAAHAGSIVGQHAVHQREQRALVRDRLGKDREKLGRNARERAGGIALPEPRAGALLVLLQEKRDHVLLLGERAGLLLGVEASGELVREASRLGQARTRDAKGDHDPEQGGKGEDAARHAVGNRVHGRAHADPSEGGVRQGIDDVGSDHERGGRHAAQDQRFGARGDGDQEERRGREQGGHHGGIAHDAVGRAARAGQGLIGIAAELPHDCGAVQDQHHDKPCRKGKVSTHAPEAGGDERAVEDVADRQGQGAGGDQADALGTQEAGLLGVEARCQSAVVGRSPRDHAGRALAVRRISNRLNHPCNPRTNGTAF